CLYYYIALIVNNALQFFRAHTQQITDLIGKTLKIPDMYDRNHQFDVPHTLATYFLFSYFYPTTVANNTLITNTLVFTAIAFVIFYRAKYFFAKQTISFGFVCTIIDSFRL